MSRELSLAGRNCAVPCAVADIRANYSAQVSRITGSAGIASLQLPAEKCGDHRDAVNESVGQNAHPQIASGQHVGGPEDQPSHPRVHYPRGTLVEMTISKEHCYDENGRPISGFC